MKKEFEYKFEITIRDNNENLTVDDLINIRNDLASQLDVVETDIEIKYNENDFKKTDERLLDVLKNYKIIRLFCIKIDKMLGSLKKFT